MLDLTSPATRSALEEIAGGFEAVGAGLRRLLAASEGASVPSGRVTQTSVEDAVEQLLRRLGPENQRFLWAVAQDFTPGDTFSLEDMANAAGTTKDSARARLMNIGRSLKSLGPLAPHLWDVSWDTGENSYEWDYETHRALLKIADG